MASEPAIDTILRRKAKFDFNFTDDADIDDFSKFVSMLINQKTDKEHMREEIEEIVPDKTNLDSFVDWVHERFMEKDKEKEDNYNSNNHNQNNNNSNNKMMGSGKLLGKAITDVSKNTVRNKTIVLNKSKDQSQHQNKDNKKLEIHKRDQNEGKIINALHKKIEESKSNFQQTTAKTNILERIRKPGDLKIVKTIERKVTKVEERERPSERERPNERERLNERERPNERERQSERERPNERERPSERERTIERERPGDEIRKKPKITMTRTENKVPEIANNKVVSSKYEEAKEIHEEIAHSEHQTASTSNLPKAPIKKRCKNWPNCKDGDKCLYVHPSDPCPKFPKCAFGESCLYIHPSIACKFGAECMRPDCAYTHPRMPMFNKYQPRYMPSYHHLGASMKAKGKFGQPQGYMHTEESTISHPGNITPPSEE